MVRLSWRRLRQILSKLLLQAQQLEIISYVYTYIYFCLFTFACLLQPELLFAVCLRKYACTYKCMLFYWRHECVSGVLKLKVVCSKPANSINDVNFFEILANYNVNTFFMAKNICILKWSQYYMRKEK